MCDVNFRAWHGGPSRSPIGRIISQNTLADLEQILARRRVDAMWKITLTPRAYRGLAAVTVCRIRRGQTGPDCADEEWQCWHCRRCNRMWPDRLIDFLSHLLGCRSRVCYVCSILARESLNTLGGYPSLSFPLRSQIYRMHSK